MTDWGAGDIILFIAYLAVLVAGLYRIVFANRIDEARIARQVDDGSGYSAQKAGIDTRTSGFIMVAAGIALAAKSLLF